MTETAPAYGLWFLCDRRRGGRRVRASLSGRRRLRRGLGRRDVDGAKPASVSGDEHAAHHGAAARSAASDGRAVSILTIIMPRMEREGCI
jgi:hypothetical protein